ncbi:hypothetical protein JCM8208_002430 [Rhodotorula glutinis]
MQAQGWPAQQGQQAYAAYPPGTAQQGGHPSSSANAVASTSAVVISNNAPLHHGQQLHDDQAGQYQHQPAPNQSYYAPAHARGQSTGQGGAPSSSSAGAGGGGGPGGAGGGYGLTQPGAQGGYAQGMVQGVQSGYSSHQVQQPPPPSRSPYPSAAPPPPPLQHRPPSRPPSIALPPQHPQQQQQQQMLHAQSAAAYGNSFVQPSLQALPASSPALMSPTAHRFNSNPSSTTGPPVVLHQQGYPPHPPQPRPSPAPPPPPAQATYAPPAPMPQPAPVPTAAGLDAHLTRLDEAAQLQHNAAQLEAVLKRGAYPGGGPRAGQPLTPDQHAQMDAQVRDLRSREMSVLTTCDTFVRAHGGSQVVNRFIEQYRASVQRQQHQQLQQQQHVQQQQHLQQHHQMQHAAAAAQAQAQAQAAQVQPRRAATMQMPPPQGYPGGSGDQLPPPRPASATPHAQMQHQLPVQRERTHTYPQQHQPGAPHPPHPHPSPAQHPSQLYSTLPPSQPGLTALQQQQQGGSLPHYQPSPSGPPPPHQQQRQAPPPPPPPAAAGPVRRMPSASAIAQQYAVQAQAQAQRQAQQQQHHQQLLQGQGQGQGQPLAHDGYGSPHPPPRQQPTPVAGAQRPHPHAHAPNGGDPSGGGGGGGGGGVGGGAGPPLQQRDAGASGMHAHVTAAAVASSRDQAQRQLAATGLRAQQQQQQMSGAHGQGQGAGQGQPGYDGRAAWEEAQRRDRDEHERRERARDLQVEQQHQQQLVQQQQQQLQAGKARLGIKHPTQVLAEGQPGWPSLADLQAQVSSQFFWDTLAQVLEKRGQRLNPQGFVLENRLVDLFRLSQVVIGQFGGYVRSDFDKSWMHIASQFGFSPSSPAPGQLRDLYMRIVGPYEDAWASNELRKLRLGGPPQQQPMHLVNGMGHAPPPPSSTMQPPPQPGPFAQPPSVTSSPAQHLPFVPSASGAGLVNATTPTPTPPTSLALPPQPTYALPQHSSAPEQSLSSIFANSFAAFPLTPSTGPSAAPVLASARSPEPTVQQLIAQAKELQREHLADRAAAENSPTKGSPRKLAGLPTPSDHDVRRSPQLQVVTAVSTLSPQTSTPREQLVPEPMQPPTPRTAVLHAASAAGQVAPFSSAPPALLRRTPSDAPYLSPGGGGGGSPPLSRTGSSSRKRERTHEPNELGQGDEDAGRRKREGTGTFAEPGAAATSSKAPQHLVVPVVGASPASMETPDLVASRALRPDSATSASTSTSVSPRSSRALSISVGAVAAPSTPGPSSALPQPLNEAATPVHTALAASASALSLGTPTSAAGGAVPASSTAGGSSEATTTTTTTTSDPLASLSFTTPVTATGFEASPALFGGSWSSDVPSYGGGVVGGSALDGSSSSVGGLDVFDTSDIFSSFATGGPAAATGATGKTLLLGSTLGDDSWSPSGLLDDFQWAADFSSHS